MTRVLVFDVIETLLDPRPFREQLAPHPEVPDALGQLASDRGSR